MKFVGEEKPKKRILPFRSPVPMAWVAYGFLTLLTVLLALPIGNLGREEFSGLTILAFAIALVSAVAMILSIRVMRYSADKGRVNFAMALLVTAILANSLAIGGGLTLGKMAGFTYMSQILALMLNVIAMLILAARYARVKHPKPVVTESPKKFSGWQGLLYFCVILPGLLVLVAYAMLIGTSFFLNK